MTSAPSNTAHGTDATRAFYDAEGWESENGTTRDRALFGTWEDGPIRQRIAQITEDRILGALRRAGSRLDLLEVGCGGNPEPVFRDRCAHYTGTDFSSKGLDVDLDEALAELRSDLRRPPRG